MRQRIADTWPNTVDDSAARADWGLEHEFEIPEMVSDMLLVLKRRLKRGGVTY